MMSHDHRRNRWTILAICVVCTIALNLLWPATVGPALAQRPWPPPPCAGDEHEPNDDWREPSLTKYQTCALAEGVPLAAQIGEKDSVDWFRFHAQPGRTYRLRLWPSATLDLALRALDPAGASLGFADAGGLGEREELVIVASAEGYYVLGVQLSPRFDKTSSAGAYTVQYRDVTPAPSTPEPTTLPSPPPPPEPQPTTLADPYEPNNTWLEAKPLAWGTAVSEQITPGDVDWWALRVKPGVAYVCTVSSAVFDPRLRIEIDAQVIAANDDRAPGDPTAEVRWTSRADAMAYAVVESTFGTGAYQLVCRAEQPTGGGGSPGGRVTPTPSSTSGQAGALSWYPVAAPVENQALTTIHVLVYTDLNDNQNFDVGEGVEGLYAYVLAGGDLIGLGTTSAQGEAQLEALGRADRVALPFLGWQQRVRPGEANEFVLRLAPGKLPTFFPVKK
jgi:hypothetical protein